MRSPPSQDRWTQVLRAGDLARFEAFLAAGADPNTPRDMAAGVPPLCWVIWQIAAATRAQWEP